MPRSVLLISFALLLATAAACDGTGGPLVDSESHFLTTCGSDSDCDAGLACYCGVCSLPCSDELACTDFDSPSACIPADQLADAEVCGPELPALDGICLSTCVADDDCSELAPGTRCFDGSCIASIPAGDPMPDVGRDVGVDTPEDTRTDTSDAQLDVEPADAADAEVTDTADAGDDVIRQVLSDELVMELRIESEWETGRTYACQLVNVSETVYVRDIVLDVDAVAELTGVWGLADGSVAGQYVPEDYQEEIAPGAFAELGFNIESLEVPVFSLSSASTGGVLTELLAVPVADSGALDLGADWTAEDLRAIEDDVSYYDANLPANLGYAAGESCTLAPLAALQANPTQALIGRPTPGTTVRVNETDVMVRVPDELTAMTLVFARDHYGIEPHALLALGVKKSFFGATDTANDDSSLIAGFGEEFDLDSADVTPNGDTGYYTPTPDGPFQLDRGTFATLLSVFPARLHAGSACGDDLTPEESAFCDALYTSGDAPRLLIVDETPLIDAALEDLMQEFRESRLGSAMPATELAILDLHMRRTVLRGIVDIGFADAYDGYVDAEAASRFELAAVLDAQTRGISCCSGYDLCTEGLDPFAECDLTGGIGESDKAETEAVCRALNDALAVPSAHDFQMSRDLVETFVARLAEFYTITPLPDLEPTFDPAVWTARVGEAYDVLLEEYRVELGDSLHETLSFRYHWRTLLAVLRAYLPGPEALMGPVVEQLLARPGGIAGEATTREWAAPAE